MHHLKKLEMHGIVKITIQKQIFENFEVIDINAIGDNGDTFEISFFDHSHDRIEIKQLPDKLCSALSQK